MRTSRAENRWEFFFQNSETLNGYQNYDENFKGSLKWL
jgi:hypothetical protein